MKLKGISPIEQHAEKGVLALLAFALLGVFAMQFTTQPNRVDTGSRRIPPQSIYTELESQAKAIDSQLKDASPLLPEVKPIDLVERYDAAVAADRMPQALTAALGTGVDVARAVGAAEIDARPSDENVTALRVPTTSGVLAQSMWGTLDPYAVQAVPEYSAFVPAAQPFDMPMVTVESSFSGTELRTALTPENGTGIPRRFWQGTGLAVMGFEVERQRLLPDGSWSQPEAITTPPGTSLPTRAVASDAGLSDLTDIVSKAAQAAEDVERPMPPPTIAGAEWAPPSESVAVDDSSLTEVDRLKRRLARAEGELARLESANNRPDPYQSDRGGGGGGGGGGKRSISGTSTRDDPGPQPREDANRQRVERKRQEIQDLRDKLRELGEVVDDRGGPGAGSLRDDRGGPVYIRDDSGAPGFGRDDRGGARPIGQPAPDAILSRESIQLWAHDLGVKPGETYRYRSRVAVNNPLYRKGPVLNPDDADLQRSANEPFARGAWSGWSDPVVVGAREYFFVSGAAPDGGAAARGATATIELYRVFYGSYRKSTLTLTPGDAVTSTIRMPSGLFLIDPSQIDAKSASDAMFAKETGSVPAGLTAVAGKLTLDLGAYVLDVVGMPVQAPDQFGAMKTVYEVLIRDRSGAVVARSPVSDTGGQAYEQASKSASEASKLALRPPGQPAVSPSAGLFPPVIAQP